MVAGEPPTCVMASCFAFPSKGTPAVLVVLWCRFIPGANVQAATLLASQGTHRMSLPLADVHCFGPSPALCRVASLSLMLAACGLSDEIFGGLFECCPSPGFQKHNQLELVDVLPLAHRVPVSCLICKPGALVYYLPHEVTIVVKRALGT